VIVLDRHDLEERARNNRECALEVIAHEIAHLYLGHCTPDRVEQDASEMDFEVAKKIMMWGFKLCGPPKFYKA
jgi:hypothetical protein